MNIEQAIREYLPQILHLSLATCANNRPWVCEVHFSYDEQLNLYFCSKTNTRHCQEISQNPQVAGNIVTQHGPGEAPRGVYFEGRAQLLTGIDEQHPAYVTYDKRFGRGQEMLSSPDKGFYKITVSDFYVFYARESKPSQKYHLAWHKLAAST